MADTITANLGLQLPQIYPGDQWGNKLNSNFAAIDVFAGGTELTGARAFGTAALVLADVALTYTPGTALSVVAGQYILTESEGFSYKVAAAAATDHHVSTAGGVKLYVLAGSAGYDVRAFGAVGNGVADDTAVFTKAAATNDIVTSADGETYATSLGRSALPKRIDGYGKVGFASGGAFSGGWRYSNTPLASIGNESSGLTAVAGDWSQNFAPRSVIIEGAATLGQPATGFQINAERAPYYVFMQNVDSGHNEALISNDGRTTWPGFRMRGFHSGQGGMMGYSSSIFVNGAQRSGVTTFLANPAAANFSAEAIAGANGVYLNPLELNCSDQGFDCAAIGPVVNMTRTNATGAVEAFWSGMRIQSKGAQAINSGYQISGKANTGLDFTKADFTSGNNAAMALKASQRIYWDASSSNDWHKTSNGLSWVSYETSGAELQFAVNGAVKLGLKDGSARFPTGPVQIETGNLALLDSSAIVAIGGARVLAARKIGWTAPTGTATRTTFATSTVTTAQLAERVKGLLDDLILHGLIGA